MSVVAISFLSGCGKKSEDKSSEDKNSVSEKFEDKILGRWKPEASESQFEFCEFKDGNCYMKFKGSDNLDIASYTLLKDKEDEYLISLLEQGKNKSNDGRVSIKDGKLTLEVSNNKIVWIR